MTHLHAIEVSFRKYKLHFTNKYKELHKLYLLNQKMLLYNIFPKADGQFYLHQLFLHMRYVEFCNTVKGPKKERAYIKLQLICLNPRNFTYFKDPDFRKNNTQNNIHTS